VGRVRHAVLVFIFDRCRPDDEIVFFNQLGAINSGVSCRSIGECVHFVLVNEVMARETAKFTEKRLGAIWNQSSGELENLV
jgi:hypothetical protein